MFDKIMKMNHNSLTTNIYYLEVRLVHVSANHISGILTTDLSSTKIPQNCPTLIVVEYPLVLDSKNSARLQADITFLFNQKRKFCLATYF